MEESGGLSARDPLPPRPLFAVESGLQKKGKNENAASSGGKEIPGFEKRNGVFFHPRYEGSMIRWWRRVRDGCNWG